MLSDVDIMYQLDIETVKHCTVNFTWNNNNNNNKRYLLQLLPKMECTLMEA
jgi:hypothetical protein